MLKEFVEKYTKKHELKLSDVRKLCAQAMFPDDEYFNRNNKFGQIYNGKYQLKASHVKAICEALKIEPNEFFNIEPPRLALNEQQYSNLCEILEIK